MAERTDEGKLARRRAVRPAMLMSAMMLLLICKLKVDVIVFFAADCIILASSLLLVDRCTLIVLQSAF
jgi:hypothetical protein